MTDQLTIVGSLARFLAGQTQRVGDIDILIGDPLCERYWDFLEILALHGICSVRDVLDRPRFPWRYCVPEIAHARSLTVDCRAIMFGSKHANLDILFNPAHLDLIDHPNANRWVDSLPKNWWQLNDSELGNEITKGHGRFINQIASETPQFSSRPFHSEVEMYYGW